MAVDRTKVDNVARQLEKIASQNIVSTFRAQMNKADASEQKLTQWDNTIKRWETEAANLTEGDYQPSYQQDAPTRR